MSLVGYFSAKQKDFAKLMASAEAELPARGAHVVEQTGAAAVVFVASLTERQRRVLTTMLGRPAVSLADLLAPLD